MHTRRSASLTPAAALLTARLCRQEFEVEDNETLCECLKSLATDGNKHRAKNDRRKQRSIFREVLHYIEVRWFSLFEGCCSCLCRFLQCLAFVFLSCRTRTSQRRRSGSEWRAFTSTAGGGGGSTTPSRRSSSPESGTIYR